MPQVREVQSSGLLLLGWAARGKGESGGGRGRRGRGSGSCSHLPGDLVERCLDVVATAERLHSMDVAIKSHAGWARSHLRGREGALVEYRDTTSEEDARASSASSSADGEGGDES